MVKGLNIAYNESEKRGYSPSLLKARDNIPMNEAGSRFIRFKVSVPD